MRIYFSQYDSYWSLSLDQAIDLTITSCANGKHDLSGYREIKSKPRSYHIYKCLDFGRNDWEITGQELIKLRMNKLLTM